jgi:hypothetical protein
LFQIYFIRIQIIRAAAEQETGSDTGRGKVTDLDMRGVIVDQLVRHFDNILAALLPVQCREILQPKHVLYPVNRWISQAALRRQNGSARVATGTPTGEMTTL